MSKARLRVCHVGCGHWGTNLLRNVAANPKADLVAICDPDDDALARAAARYRRATTHPHLEAALADADFEAVILATPAGLHFEQALGALSAGKHVLVEKPLADTTARAQELVAVAAQTGLVLMVGHTFLYNNVVHAVKRYIDDGTLGEVYYAYSQRLNLGRFRHDSDVLWTLAPHDLSILNLWFGDRPAQVSARGRSYIHRSTNRAEVSFADMYYPDGKAAHLHLSWLDPQKRREMVVVGSQKMLVYDDMNPEAHIRLYDKRAESEHQSDMADFADFGTRLRAGDLVIPNIRLTEPLSVETDHFFDCVREGKTPRTGARDGLDVVAALEALSRSQAADGALVEVDYPALDMVYADAE